MIAEERDGMCLSTEYKDNRTPLMWRCSKNHVWSAPLSRIKNLGQWCPQCAGNMKLTLEVTKQIALLRGGECLSERYVNQRLPLLWRCIKGHIWNASFNNIKNHGKWCPHCAGNARLTLEDAKQIALSRNGKCLSTSYSNSKIPMTWKCHQGHIWSSPFHNIKNSGSWCPYCAGIAKLTLEDAKEIALSRSGECLSIEKQWCPFCIGRYQTIEDMRKLAQVKNGDCLSDQYYNSRTKLEWICENKHQWKAIPNSIQQGTWCPFCPKYKREKLCHEILTKYLGAPSLIRRPDFLKTQEYPNGLELDIFYPQYGFTIEVQGIQHEKYHEFFHGGDPNNFIKQQAWDQLKKELCEENWIALRYVWYYEDPYIVIPKHLLELGLIE
ncbi:4818_t:CDS:2 [Entrophospora sp. SA101]|nr:4818_t:CDS:2 [Entrophospora sp. SA101]CAJ0849116.1 17256_t:CDS:2 [Entrophospora sp. SA101]